MCRCELYSVFLTHACLSWGVCSGRCFGWGGRIYGVNYATWWNYRLHVFAHLGYFLGANFTMALKNLWSVSDPHIEPLFNNKETTIFLSGDYINDKSNAIFVTTLLLALVKTTISGRLRLPFLLVMVFFLFFLLQTIGETSTNLPKKYINFFFCYPKY